jgi:FkbM family methyltransferase
MYKKIAFFSIAIFFLITGLSHIENPNSPNPQDSSVFAGEILESGKKLYSQYDEELIIRDFFNDRKGGIFVDVGCAHYKEMSTTYYLEERLGWSGIAVDALAEFAIGYIQHRPNTRFFNFIVTDHPWNIEPFYRLINATGLSSTSENYTQKAADYFRVSKEYQVTYVPTITLTELLEKNGISKIDFLSMDIEGGELKALSGFNIKKFKPELVCIEVHSKTSDKIMNYFTSYGYERIDEYLKYDNVNWYFKPKE